MKLDTYYFILNEIDRTYPVWFTKELKALLSEIKITPKKTK